MNPEVPLVSCLCPTANRREFLYRCLQCFKEQDYPHLELIILEDGDDSVRDIIPNDSRIRYYYELPKKNHGEKMNRCMELAEGEFCIVFDDDDWYSPNRVSRQIQPFIDNPNVLVTGTSRLYYYLHGTQQAYRYQNWTTQPWIGAFAIRRSVWEAQSFDNIPAGMDCKMLNRIPQENWKDLNALDLLVATIHPNNASAKKVPSISFIETPWEEIEKITKGALL
jgi:glycosyltransferase involved in cell wall biosynthesis